MVRVFIGYDSHETIAAHVLAHSIDRLSSTTLPISLLRIDRLPVTRVGSTEFAYTRFLVPWLSGFKGFSVFLDCDMLCRVDLNTITKGLNERHAVSVVKHDYQPKDQIKFLGNPQHKYERKNWSSVMVFNNALCPVLTPEYVEAQTGLHLHQFKWLQDWQIGELDKDWNHLVGEYEPNPNAKIVHYTLGTPCFAKYRHCEFSNEWFQERNLMMDYDRLGEYSRPEKEAA